MTVVQNVCSSPRDYRLPATNLDWLHIELLPAGRVKVVKVGIEVVDPNGTLIVTTEDGAKVLADGHIDVDLVRLRPVEVTSHLYRHDSLET